MGRLSIKGKLQKARTKRKAVSVLLEWSDSYQSQFRLLHRRTRRVTKKAFYRHFDNHTATHSTGRAA